MAYSDKVIDHYENPRNVGSLDPQREDVGTGLVGAPACGDVMRLQIRVNEEGVMSLIEYIKSLPKPAAPAQTATAPAARPAQG